MKITQVNHFADWRTQLRQYRLIHGGTVQTYLDLAALFDVELCGSCDAGSPARHSEGFVGRSRTVHWSVRRPNRRGVRRFLKLVAEIRIARFSAYSPAMRIYAANAWAARAAGQIHLRFPASYSRTDRLMVRWLAGQGQHVTEPARRWAYRKETHT